jgi:hypothetical protein
MMTSKKINRSVMNKKTSKKMTKIVMSRSNGDYD